MPRPDRVTISGYSEFARVYNARMNLSSPQMRKNFGRLSFIQIEYRPKNMRPLKRLGDFSTAGVFKIIATRRSMDVKCANVEEVRN